MKVTDNGHKRTIKKLDLHLKTYSQYNKKKAHAQSTGFFVVFCLYSDLRSRGRSHNFFIRLIRKFRKVADEICC